MKDLAKLLVAGASGALVVILLIGATTIETDGDVETSAQFISTATTGPPLVVSSSALVTGLNADRVDGLEAAAFALAAGTYTQSQVDALDALLQTQIDDLTTVFDLRVVDSTGATIGPVMGYDSSSVRVDTFLRLGVPEEAVFFDLTPNGYVLSQNASDVWFTGIGCTGDVYLTGGDQFSGARFGFGSPGVLYKAPPGIAGFTAAARWTSPTTWQVGDLTNRCQNLTPVAKNGHLATQFDDLNTLGFVPNFEVE